MKEVEGVISLSEFPSIFPEIDDSARIKRAVKALKNTPGKNKLTFPHGRYVVSDSLTGDISLIDKLIDGYGALFVDKRIKNVALFRFNTCNRVTLQNLIFVSEYDYSIVSNTIKDVGALILFDKKNNSIDIKNIRMSNIFGTGIWIAPRADLPCTNINIENITSDHLRKSTLYLSSLVRGAEYAPSAIKNIRVTNLVSNYCGAYYDINGVSTRASESHWTAGVDFGEALSLLKNATFTNCHVSYASESGFHSEGGNACVNVQFHNCSSRFNGAREDAVYGYGWFTVQGVSIVNCITEGNKFPYRFNEKREIMAYQPGNTYHVDLYDRDYGKIFDNGQKLLTFNSSDELSVISQDGDKKSYNFMDRNTQKMSFGHSNFLRINSNHAVDGFKYYLSDTNYTDLIKFERFVWYKIVIQYKKTDTINTNIAFSFRGPNVTDGQKLVYIKNDLRITNLNKLMETSRTFRIDTSSSELLAMRIGTLNQVYGCKIIKLLPDTNNNLIVNPLLDETKEFDLRYYSQNHPGSANINTPDNTLVYKVADTAGGRWVTINPLAEPYAWWKRVYSHDFPIIRHQKVSVTIVYESDASVDNIDDYLQLRLSVYGEDGVLKGNKDQDIKDVSTTSKTTTFIMDGTNFIESNKCYFNISAAVVTNKTYDVVTPIKFKIVEVHLTY
ncbi:hypothetical protein QRD90_18250 [Peribacillus frigoritolerans]|uniref:hypothetical protein n=1 Tax=Peribacillus frigoritolerans TaxID=450367 RepID=UPI002570521B|nr:hypothetical protein [Peribacillus frigoritolerans]WJE46156.1 hypothetical protein QRD90_18250 [Peribacillus frigoritolerans]